MNIIEAFNEAERTGVGIRLVGSNNTFYVRTRKHSDTGIVVSRKVLSPTINDKHGEHNCELNEFFINGKWEFAEKTTQSS